MNDEKSEIDSTPRSGGKTPAMSLEKQQKARRKFLRTCSLAAGVTGLSLLGYLPALNAKEKHLRPPGALDEADFLASCIKCGQCVQVCPVQAIKLGDITDGFGNGVPFIAARDQACDFSCDAVQCILACPTGALTYKKPPSLGHRPGAVLPAAPVLKAKANDPEPTLNLKERIGVARLSRPEQCLALQGKGFVGKARGESFHGQLRYMTVDRWKPIPVKEHPYELPLCDLCVRECPIENAISLVTERTAEGKQVGRPVVHEGCVGCGVCEMICPAESAAITIEAQAVWEGGRS